MVWRYEVRSWSRASQHLTCDSVDGVFILTWLYLPVWVLTQGLQHVTDAELRDAGVEDPTHRERILNQLSTDRRKMEPQTGDSHTHTHTHHIITSCCRHSERSCQSGSPSLSRPQTMWHCPFISIGAHSGHHFIIDLMKGGLMWFMSLEPRRSPMNPSFSLLKSLLLYRDTTTLLKQLWRLVWFSNDSSVTSGSCGDEESVVFTVQSSVHCCRHSIQLYLLVQRWPSTVVTGEGGGEMILGETIVRLRGNCSRAAPSTGHSVDDQH